MATPRWRALFRENRSSRIHGIYTGFVLEHCAAKFPPSFFFSVLNGFKAQMRGKKFLSCVCQRLLISSRAVYIQRHSERAKREDQEVERAGKAKVWSTDWPSRVLSESRTLLFASLLLWSCPGLRARLIVLSSFFELFFSFSLSFLPTFLPSSLFSR